MSIRFNPVRPVVFLILAIGCATGLAVSAQPITYLSDLPAERTARSLEWRTFWLSPGSGTRYLGVGEAEETSALRIGVLPPAGGKKPTRVRIEVAGETVAQFEAGPFPLWNDRLFPLERAGDCIVEIDAPGDVRLAPCEIVTDPPTKPNVLIYLIDTLRQDHLGCYGYSRDTSPYLDAFAKDAVRFTEAVPQSSWTRPSIASMVTSVYSEVHGVMTQQDVTPTNLPTLQGALQEAGYETQVFMTNTICLPQWGFDVGFDRFVNLKSQFITEKDDKNLVDAVIASLDHLGTQPWLLYAHSMTVHVPYYVDNVAFRARYLPILDRISALDVPDRYTELSAMRKNTVNAYDASVAYADIQFGRLMDTLKERGLYDDTLIIVFADHGQEFWEHGIHGHGRLLIFEGVLRVPFLVKLPGNAHAGKTIADIVEGVDIAPTVLDLVDVPAPDTFEGRSLLPLMKGQDTPPHVGSARLKQLMIAKTAAYKFAYDMDNGKGRWFDLKADPKELYPLDTPPPGQERLAQRIAEQLVAGEPGLNLLLTRGEEWPEGLTVELKGDGITGARVRGEHLGAHVENNGNEARVALTNRTDESWGFTRLCFDAKPDAELSLAVRPEVDILTFNSTAGEDTSDRVTPVDDTIRPMNRVAPPNAFKLSELPDAFGVYLWYVPQGKALDVEALDDQTRNALEALGYLGAE